MPSSKTLIWVGYLTIASSINIENGHRQVASAQIAKQDPEIQLNVFVDPMHFPIY